MWCGSVKLVSAVQLITICIYEYSSAYGCNAWNLKRVLDSGLIFLNQSFAVFTRTPYSLFRGLKIGNFNDIWRIIKVGIYYLIINTFKY